MVPAVQQKFNELEVSLRHLQQNINIPEVQLVVNPEVMEVVEKATAKNKKPSVVSFGTRVTDSNFLNTLQKDVNRWKTDIQKVIVLVVQCDGLAYYYLFIFDRSPLLTETPLQEMPSRKSASG